MGRDRLLGRGRRWRSDSIEWVFFFLVSFSLFPLYLYDLMACIDKSSYSPFLSFLLAHN